MRLATAVLPALALTVLALPALPAAAQDRPPLNPSRDVAVTYRAEATAGAGAGQPAAEMRLSWLNAEGKMRVDLPGGIGWSVTEAQSGRSFMVMEQQRMVMQVPAAALPGGGNPLQASPTARFTRGGTETLVGLTCNVWRFQDGDASGEACVTADGVMLRSRGTAGGQGGQLTATQVQYGPQDPARFREPAGYQTMQMPTQPPPGGAAPGAARPPR